MARKSRPDGELWGAEGVDELWTGSDYDVAILAKETGKLPIEVRLAIMKVGQDRALIIRELQTKH